MDGHDVLRELRADPATQDIPVIFVTALDDAADEELGLSLGAVDYITKPITPSVALAGSARISNSPAPAGALPRRMKWLEAEVHRRMAETRLIQELCIRALACLSETRDKETGRHINRTQAYVGILAQHLAGHPRFAAALAGATSKWWCMRRRCTTSARVGIPDAILRKPGRLTPEEYAIMKTHAVIGARAIEAAMGPGAGRGGRIDGRAGRGRARLPSHRAGDRARASREMGRLGLSEWPGGRGDPRLGPADGIGRCL